MGVPLLHPESQPVRVGILGAGFMGATHARAFASTNDTHIGGIWSRQREKAEAIAAEIGSVAWEDANALLESPEIDAVIITLPTFVHREYAVAALNAGKAVLLEKPMALTLADCDAILDAQRQSGSLLMIAHTLRFWPEYETAIALAKSGALGKVQSAVAGRHTTHASWSPWFGDATLSGGAVLDLHIHDLDLMNWLCGEPQSIHASGAIGPSGGYDLAFTALDYGDVKCLVEGNGMMPKGYPFSAYLSIRCERGVIEYIVRAAGDQIDSTSEGANQMLVHEIGKATRLVVADEGAGEDAYVRQAAAFVRAVQSRSVPAGGEPRVGRLAVQVALATRASIEQRAIVHL